MAGYIGANTSSVTNNQNAAERRKKFTFTAATTALTGLNFAPQKIHIFHNGIRLVRTTDYTEAADGKSVTLINAAQAGDEVVAVTFSQNPSSGGYSDTDVDAHLLTAGVTLDATNNRVGINESAPSGILHVKGTSAAHGKIILEAGGSGGSANNNFMEFNKHDGTKLGELEVGESVTNGGSLVFKTTPSGGSATTRMTVNHDGYVTTPNQPAFHVSVNATQTLSNSSTVVFQQQFTNIGSHYNTSNGIFTAPVTGFYSFTYRLLHESVSNGHAVDSFLSRNNSGGAGFCFQSQRHKYQADYTGHAGYIYESSSGMIYLAANDTMRVKYGGAQNSTIHNNQNWCYFCGYLLG